MAPKFGTSGLRGLVTELTPELVADYARAFLAACDTGGTVHVGWDRRASSPDIAEAVITAIRTEGVDAISAGVLPTPALALQSMEAGHGAIMITGSHIPADRNGLKFYLPTGEISKADEAAILGALGRPAGSGSMGARSDMPGLAPFAARYVQAFGADALAGLRLGIYQHSSVASEVMGDVARALGATAIPLAPSDTFIPVDTEAVDADTRTMLAGWIAEHNLDAILSTDGDADRPMLCDAEGAVVPGDVLGCLTAQMLGAKVICTPVSSNSMVQDLGFDAVTLTRIGSPYVIAAMEETLAQDPGAKVVGYEANGGFILGFKASGPAGHLPPLMTRDSLLPMLAPLFLAHSRGQSLTALQATLPARFTAADRIAGIESDRSRAFLDVMRSDPARRAAFCAKTGEIAAVDETDGLRIRFTSSDVIHLRPSGNAPEFRCYAEAASKDRARALAETYLAALRAELGQSA